MFPIGTRVLDTSDNEMGTVIEPLTLGIGDFRVDWDESGPCSHDNSEDYIVPAALDTPTDLVALARALVDAESAKAEAEARITDLKAKLRAAVA